MNHASTAAIEALRQQVDDLAARVAKLERAETPLPTLQDILRAYPGGIPALAASGGTTADWLYKFSTGRKPVKFSLKTAEKVLRAFGRRKAFGERVDMQRLRAAWAVARAARERAAS